MAGLSCVTGCSTDLPATNSIFSRCALATSAYPLYTRSCCRNSAVSSHPRSQLLRAGGVLIGSQFFPCLRFLSRLLSSRTDSRRVTSAAVARCLRSGTHRHGAPVNVRCLTRVPHRIREPSLAPSSRGYPAVPPGADCSAAEIRTLAVATLTTTHPRKWR